MTTLDLIPTVRHSLELALEDGPVLVLGEPTGLALELSRRGPQGPRGPVGPSGGSALARTADRDLSGHRVVRATSESGVDYADPASLLQLATALGITTGAALEGEDVTVLTTGELTEPSWAWTPDLPIYVGASGTLTQSAPLSGGLCIAGFATSTTSMLVRIQPPIVLG